MPTFVVRVWLPDRPGALGSVASRIGAVRGDLVAIDILERGAGRAIDELVVELPEDELVDLLVRELHEVDGVDVEEVRKMSDTGRRDPRLTALEAAADIVAKRSPRDVLEALLVAAVREFESTWAVVVDTERGAVEATLGDAPPAGWITAFAAGAGAAAERADELQGTGDVAIAKLEVAGMALVVGRPGRAVRAVERQQIAALARVADARWAEMARKGSLSIHPSAVGD